MYVRILLTSVLFFGAVDSKAVQGFNFDFGQKSRRSCNAEIFGFDLHNGNCYDSLSGQIDVESGTAVFDTPLLSQGPFHFEKSDQVCMPAGWDPDEPTPMPGTYSFYEAPSPFGYNVGIMFIHHHAAVPTPIPPTSCGSGNGGYGYWYICHDFSGSHVSFAEGPYFGKCR